LIGYKAVDVSIEAMGRLPSEVRSRTSLSVLGDGELRGELEALAASHGVAERVEFCGAVPQTAVLERLRRAHALVIPSIEGLGLVAAEAMSAGRAVIGSDDGGVPEMVVDGETGLRVRAGDAGSLAVAIERMWREPGLAARLGVGARAFMEGGEFDARRAMDVLEERLRRLVARRRG
jgi:colanic acid/amylovoran biosynthesis glycosyltransferase